MDENFDMQTYMTRGVEKIVADSLKSEEKQSELIVGKADFAEAADWLMTTQSVSTLKNCGKS